ncbi:type II toxin-antitoxin system Phd/YefM family antitoxin [bacterium]|nr:type II toxin-antitoxin system Phd/YefM family antitoxin [bacterium]
MMQIRPVSDLRNKFSDIESLVFLRKEPVFLTKNGYGSMVVMSIDMYESLTENIEAKLDAADIQAEETAERLSHDEVFSTTRTRIRKTP